jgi:adenosylcobinamide-phosphate synthase
MTLSLALLLDAIFGEPKWLWDRAPHPAVLMGRAIGWAEARMNTGPKQLMGAAMLAGLVAAAVVLGLVIEAVPGGAVLSVVLAAILLAQASLVHHVRAVADALRLSLADGRACVAMIVGRDTGEMDQSAVARAAIESAAENLSDGVVAPAFWYLIGGLPGILAYKVINTADSMVGYRTPRFEAFGWASARLDDLVNWVPARLTAALIAAAALRADLGAMIARDARLHRSPNAGWPEAAMAGALGIALSGPRSYEGQMRDFPFVNPAGRRDPGPDDIDACAGMLWRAWALFFGVVTLAALVF